MHEARSSYFAALMASCKRVSGRRSGLPTLALRYARQDLVEILDTSRGRAEAWRSSRFVDGEVLPSAKDVPMSALGS
jgi:hypothetical protein